MLSPNARLWHNQKASHKGPFLKQKYMIKKVPRIILPIVFVICLCGFQTGCQTGQATSVNNLNPPVTRDTISDDDIQELFINSGLREDDANFKKLMALPRERVVAVVQKLKDDGVKKSERDSPSQFGD